MPGVQKPHCSAECFEERGLHGVQLAAGVEVLDGLDRAAVELHRERRARAHRQPVELHGAGPADLHLAARLGARQPEVSQEVQQQRRVVDAQRVLAAVDAAGDRRSHVMPLPSARTARLASTPVRCRLYSSLPDRSSTGSTASRGRRGQRVERVGSTGHAVELVGRDAHRALVDGADDDDRRAVEDAVPHRAHRGDADRRALEHLELAVAGGLRPGSGTITASISSSSPSSVSYAPDEEVLQRQLAPAARRWPAPRGR